MRRVTEFLQDVKGIQILNCLVDFIKKPAHKLPGETHPQANTNWPTGNHSVVQASHYTPPPWASSLCVLLTVAQVGFGRLPKSTHRKLAESSG